MGRHAQSAWIIRLFAIVLATAWPALAFAAVTADGVALGALAGCGNGRLDVTLTNNGADRESWRATSLAGTLVQDSGFTSFPSSGTSNGFFPQQFVTSQPSDTLIGSYANVGSFPADANNTAEFFVFYKCSLTGAQQVLLKCFGPYGTCPQTAEQALALTATAVPMLGAGELALLALLVVGLGGRALSRRTR